MKTNSFKILHVDDDEDDQLLFKRALKSVDADLEIIEAHDGEEGLDYLKQMKESNDLPSLIVLDINMPKVNGREACMAIKRDDVLSSIPMIIFSTSSSMLDKLFFQGKNVQYITKPTDYGHFMDIANNILSYCHKQVV